MDALRKQAEDSTTFTRLEFISEDAPLGLRQLRELLAENQINLFRTPGGRVRVGMAPPINSEALKFVALMVQELRDELAPLLDRIPVLANPRNKKTICRWMTPEFVANFKAARAWLLEHLDALLAAGWARDELFRVRRPLGHPYCWGVAWDNRWRTADAVVLQSNGWIAYHYRQRDGSVNVLHSWPGANKITEDRK